MVVALTPSDRAIQALVDAGQYIIDFDVPVDPKQTPTTKFHLGGKCWSGNYMSQDWIENYGRDAVPVGGNLHGGAYRDFLIFNNFEESIENQVVATYQWLQDNPDEDPVTAYNMAQAIKDLIKTGHLQPELVSQMNTFFINAFIEHLVRKTALYNQINNSNIAVNREVLKGYAISALESSVDQKPVLDEALIIIISDNNSQFEAFIRPIVVDFAIMLRSSFNQLEDRDSGSDDSSENGDEEGAGLFESLPASFWNWQEVIKEVCAEVFDGPRAISSTFRYWIADNTTLPLVTGNMPLAMMVKDRTENGYSAVVYVSLTGVTQVTIAGGFDSVVKGDNDTLNYFFSNDELSKGSFEKAIRFRSSYQTLPCFPNYEAQVREFFQLALVSYNQSIELGYPADQEFGNDCPGNLQTISQYQVRKWHGGGISTSFEAFALEHEPLTKSVAQGPANSAMICKGKAFFAKTAEWLPRDMNDLVIIAPNAGTDYRKIVLAWGTNQEASGFLAHTGSVTAHVSAVLNGKMLCGVSVKGLENIEHGDNITCVVKGGQVFVYKEDIPFYTQKINYSDIPTTRIKTGLVLTEFGWADKDAFLPNVSGVSLLRWEMMESSAVINELPVLPMPCYIYYPLMPDHIKQQIDCQRAHLSPIDFYVSVMSNVFSGVLNSFAGRQVNLRLPDYRVPVEANFFLPESVFKNPDNPDCGLSGARLLAQGGELGSRMLAVCGDILSELKRRGYTNFAPMLPNVAFPELDALPVVDYLATRGITPQEYTFVCMDEVPTLGMVDRFGNAIYYKQLANMGIKHISYGGNDTATALLKIARDQTPIYALELANSPVMLALLMQKAENARKYGMAIGSCGFASEPMLEMMIQAGFDSVGLPGGLSYVEGKRLLARLEAKYA